METLGIRLKALRKHRGLNQDELGEAVGGLSYSQISQMENDRSAPAETVKAIAKYFKVSEAWLVNGEGEAPKGVVIPKRKENTENPYKDALVAQLKADNDNLKRELERLWGVINYVSGGKIVKENFLRALSKARVTGKLVRMYEEPGAQLGASLIS